MGQDAQGVAGLGQADAPPKMLGDRDLNVVFPVERLRELAAAGEIGGVARLAYGFMGHITGPHLETLKRRSAPEVAARLGRARVDAVLLAPG